MSSKEDKRKSLLSGVSLVAAAAAALAGSPAHAQDASSDDDDAIVVTGSRIPQPNLYTTSPITQLTAEDITTQGATRVEDMTNQLPQVFAAQGSNISNGASGTATVDLRGLGAARTLVLIDGRRMGYGSITDSAADLNQIPGPLVERVEVLTGGASAVYGSDAIAGVVNFIMRDDFEGFRVDGQYSFHQHSNDSDDGYIRQVIAARAATNPAQFQLPQDNVTTGYGQEITAIFGVSAPDGRGNVTAYASYRHDDAVLQRDYDYSSCSLDSLVNPASTSAVAGVPAGAQHWSCGGSSTTSPGRIFSLVNGANVTPRGPGGAFIPYSGGTHAYNFGPLNYYQRPSERYTAGAFGHYEINENVEAYAQVMFSDYSTVAQIAPSGAFFGTPFEINCGDPNLGSTRATTLGCTAGDIAADTTIPVFIGRRNTEGGGRQDNRSFESYRTVLGFRGPVSDSWDYDVSAQFSRVRLSQVYQNDFSNARLGRALDVIDAGFGPVCRTGPTALGGDGTDPSCVPYDIWNPGGVTQDALDYLQIPLVRTGDASQQVVSASLTGELGVHSPWAESGIAASVGLEYRRDDLLSVTDTAFTTGDGAGQGGPTLGLQGDTDVFDFFTEARIPIVEGAAFADLLSIDVAYRYSSYNNGITTDTYKVGGEWAPYEDLRFRGSFQRAVRAANIIELFASQGAGLFDMAFDPCDDIGDDALNNNSIPASCIGANPWQVTVGQSDSGLLASPAGQYNGLFGGNPNLTPEVSDTTTLGFVFAPQFLPGFNVSLDWFHIEVSNLVATTGAQNTLNDCYVNLNAASCARITRDPSLGSLWVAGGEVEDLNTNIGGIETTGVDINANYSVDVGSMGSLGFQLVGTWLDELITDPGQGITPYDCAGNYGQVCGTPNPEWRHRFRVSWETPWSFDVDATWRYYGSVDQVNGAGTPIAAGDLDSSFDAISYFDVSGSWDVLDNTSLRFGVNNVLDTDPPLSNNVGAGSGNGNTYPQVYEALGRYVFAGFTVDF